MIFQLLFFVLAVISAHAVEDDPWTQDTVAMASMIDELTSGLPPGSVEFICTALCENDKVHEDTESSLAKLSEKVEQLQISLNSVIDQLGNIGNTGSGEDSSVPEIWKKKYFVAQEVSPYGHYMFSKYQAEQACEEKGGKLATLKQLEAAYEEGLDYCSCGWVADGFAAYPIHYPRDGCNEKLPPGIRDCTWQRTWNAWCFNIN